LGKEICALSRSSSVREFARKIEAAVAFGQCNEVSGLLDAKTNKQYYKQIITV
jgi:hypothetical protein